MKKVLLGLAIALAAPMAAHAAEDAPRKVCCESMKEGCCCCDKKGADHSDHAEHKNMQH